MTYDELDYDDGTAQCPVSGCNWKVARGREMFWPDHRDEFHNGDIT